MAVTLGSKNVGDVVKLNENGALVDFIVVQKGLPSGVYSSSCDGVWLKRRVPITGGTSSDHNDYENGPARSWLENTYYNYFDDNIRKMIRQVKIPYSKGNGASQTIQTGENGLLSRCFLLSATEYGAEESRLAVIGSKLSYFQNCGIGKTSKEWGYISDKGNYISSTIETRSPHLNHANYMCKLSTSFEDSGARGETRWGRASNVLRPCFILPHNALVGDDGNVIANTAPSTPGSISVPGSVQGGSTITVSWSASSDAQGNLEGYKVERSVNSGASWQQIYQGGGTSTTNNVAYGTNTVMYRVKAYDSMGLESGYRTSSNVTVINNTAPGSPQGITVPADVRGGSTLKISWGPSVDAENNLAGYELERSVNGGTWTQIYRNTQQSFTDNITFGWQTVAYRVRAYDAYSAYSGYATSEARAVDNNRPPHITCDHASGSDLGIKSEDFSISYTVTDQDNNTGDVTVTETFNGVKKKEFRPELGAVNTFAVEGTEFQCLPNGQHNISISASDGKASCTHTLIFTKSVTSAMITFETPLEADDQITACAIAVSGYIPQDAQFRVLVTNNDNDAEPKWENCTQMVKDGANYVFSNQTAENGYAFNFRITVSRGESGEGGYITSVQGGFQ